MNFSKPFLRYITVGVFLPPIILKTRLFLLLKNLLFETSDSLFILVNSLKVTLILEDATRVFLYIPQ